MSVLRVRIYGFKGLFNFCKSLDLLFWQQSYVRYHFRYYYAVMKNFEHFDTKSSHN
jgi:hypothetical protein